MDDAPMDMGGWGTYSDDSLVSRRASQPPTVGMHVWVVDPPERDGKWPGLVAERREQPLGQAHRVIYALDGPDGRTLLIDRWFDADTRRKYVTTR